MRLYYDERDDRYHETRGSRILYWLDDLGAAPLAEARAEAPGFLFAGARSMADYRRRVAGLPMLRDAPDERAPLLTLDTVLDAVAATTDLVPTPRTWRLPVDAPLPDDLVYPLFVRTTQSSWKVGGGVSRVHSARELLAEAAELRRAFRWDALILARAWHDLAEAGRSVYGPVPQEVRVWIVDQVPFAWSFHHLNVVSAPSGFPPTQDDLRQIEALARAVGRAFRSRLVAADFAKETSGTWLFIEAGPGSCAGTAHEGVFKAVAARLCGEAVSFRADAVGGLLPQISPAA